MQNWPSVGDKVFMSAMADDVQIEIAEVPEDQPLAEADGYYFIIDQYGEEHMVEMDGDSWVTGTIDALSPEGFDRWLARSEALAAAVRFSGLEITRTNRNAKPSGSDPKM